MDKYIKNMREHIIQQQDQGLMADVVEKNIAWDHHMNMVDVMASSNLDQEQGTRSFKYPYYPLSSALKLAAAVKDLGGVRTAIKKSLLAKQLGTAENAAAFAQGLTSAKAFGVLDGHGDYSLTEISKRYFFPTTETDKSLALLDAFAAPAAFAELLKRFDGDKLPTRDILGNILHRELGVPDSWKERVASLFCTAAQDVGVIDEQGFLRYDAARHSSGEASTDTQTQQEDRQSKPPVADQGQKGRQRESIPDMVVWTHPYKDTRIEVWTPPQMDKELWDLLEGYVKLLKPRDSS